MRKKTTLLISMALFAVMSCFAQDVTIKGTVRDKTGISLPGVSVNIKNTKSTVSTNADGVYTITAPGNATLVFTMIGFKTEEIAVNNRTQVDIELAESVNELSDVVVVGYGTAL